MRGEQITDVARLEPRLLCENEVIVVESDQLGGLGVGKDVEYRFEITDSVASHVETIQRVSTFGSWTEQDRDPGSTVVKKILQSQGDIDRVEDSDGETIGSLDIIVGGEE